MANLNEAFNLNYQPKCKLQNYMNNMKKNIYEDDIALTNQNIISNNFCNINNAYDRVKVSNEKYDNITYDFNKPTYGYICKECNGPINYHVRIQNKFPHDFIRGEYRRLNKDETI